MYLRLLFIKKIRVKKSSPYSSSLWGKVYLWVSEAL